MKAKGPVKPEFNREAWALRGATNLQRADDHQMGAARRLVALGKRLMRSRVDSMSVKGWDRLFHEVAMIQLQLRLCRRKHEDQVTDFIDGIMGGDFGEDRRLFCAKTREGKGKPWSFFNGEDWTGSIKEAKRFSKWSEAHSAVFLEHERTGKETQVHPVKVKTSPAVDQAVASFHRKMLQSDPTKRKGKPCGKAPSRSESTR